ncbi:MarR family transcriptional regulator [Nocardioides marmoriginsengisoli]|uniref:MarR family transcriptional regulator n=1 Tax=Nocardioides marmoriginsengisoli TaxID=661483 RepID=A0A3N0CAH0_9ACTN|nr:MarR family winged helix-turn-helix transcriptional regulator [Nocardioides marmoriginsengisoli]RNL60450.1 MarR family transcriptional regulator [Nocardioides marmoriginsengisoli]
MPTTTDIASTVRVLELELTLLARHQLSSAQHAPDLGLDRSGYQLLCRLEVGAMTLKQLAEAFRLDISTVNRQIAALRHKGLVERVADPAGGVAQLLQPTRTGLELLERDRNVKRGHISQLLATWDPDDVDQLHRLLAKLNTSIEDREGRPWPRP